MTIRSIYKRLMYPWKAPLTKWYLRKPRTYQAGDIQLKVAPGVFHPGLFLSTGMLLEYLQTIDLAGKRVLELGAGSGLLSIYSANKGANVVATDISPDVIECLKENGSKNRVKLTIIQSDLFEHIPSRPFDLVLINPPYYPRDPASQAEKAWYCGKDFQYFERLFAALAQQLPLLESVIMVLSEDCRIKTISQLANRHGLHLHEIHRAQKRGEWNYLFQVNASN